MINTITRQSAAWMLAFALVVSEPAMAGSFSVNPVRLTLSAKQSAGVLTLRNNGAQPGVVQLEVVSWSQQDGQDITAPTREILATPPIFTVPAGGSQIVRVGLRKPPDARREVTYRLVLHEVPPAPSTDSSGLQVALRFSVPVFVLPAVPATAELVWEATRTPQGTLHIKLSNSGNAHIQIINFTLSPRDSSESLAEQSGAAYVLPNQSHDWIVKPMLPLAAGRPLHVFVRTDAGDMRSDVVLNEAP
jgi:fimbrial chaperone protein